MTSQLLALSQAGVSIQYSSASSHLSLPDLLTSVMISVLFLLAEAATALRCARGRSRRQGNRLPPLGTSIRAERENFLAVAASRHLRAAL